MVLVVRFAGVRQRELLMMPLCAETACRVGTAKRDGTTYTLVHIMRQEDDNLSAPIIQ